MNNQNLEKFQFIFLILTAIFLFGGLILSAFTNSVDYFLYGYPLAVVFLLMAYRIRSKIR